MKAHVALDVHAARMHVVDLGHVHRQRTQVRALDREEVARHGTDLALEAPVDLVAPSQQLRVQVVESLEAAAGAEVVLDVVEGALQARRAIGVADGVRDESEAEALSQGLHLRRGLRVAARPAADRHGAVVEHAARGSAADVHEPVGQEAPALESAPAREGLREDHPDGGVHRALSPPPVLPHDRMSPGSCRI